MSKRTRRYFVAKNLAKQILPGRYQWPGPVDDSDSEFMRDAGAVLMDWPEAVPRPLVGLVRDVDYCPYWTKYRSFLETNEIPYEIFDIHHSDWYETAQRYDVIVWRPMGFPHELEECRRKYWLISQRLGIVTMPGYGEAVLYEDKAMQYEVLRSIGAPVAETFISHCEIDSLAFAAEATYPIVWKVISSSGSEGVELVTNPRRARRLVRSVFSFCGRRTSTPYQKQKNVVYMQRYIENAGYDARVIVSGDAVFGYYRDVPEGDFRASGMRTVRYGELPREAMDIACEVADKMGFPYLAVDMLPNPNTDAEDAKGSPYLITEVSPYTGWPQSSRWGLIVDGVPGVYRRGGDGYAFQPGKYWPQHFALAQTLNERWIAPHLAEAAETNEGAGGAAGSAATTPGTEAGDQADATDADADAGDVETGARTPKPARRTRSLASKRRTAGIHLVNTGPGVFPANDVAVILDGDTSEVDERGQTEDDVRAARS